MVKFAGCMKCGKQSTCRVSSVYYARVINVSSTTQDRLLTTQTRTVTTYSMPQKWDVPICSDCIIKNKKKNLILTPIILGLFMGFAAALTEFNNIALYVFGGFWLVVFTIVLISLIRKKYQTNISDNDVYVVARAALKKQHSKSKGTRYEYWPKYPSHLK